jgi:hypothetical protein
MKTLVEHFEERQNELKEKLNRARTIDESIDIVQDEIRWLGDMDGSYIGGLSTSSARIAIEGLLILCRSFQTLKAIEQQNTNSSVEPPKQNLDSNDFLNDKKLKKCCSNVKWICIFSWDLAAFTSISLSSIAGTSRRNIDNNRCR